jgi:hypothetical protein
MQKNVQKHSHLIPKKGKIVAKSNQFIMSSV